RYVLVKQGLIDRISTSSIADNNIEHLDGEGKYLMPGLAEMHAHIPSPDWGRRDTDATLFLYLANGITTIRGMLGHPVHLELRSAVRMGKVMSPRIFTSSPSLNGTTVPTAEEARKKVKEYKSAGYDFLKIHPGIKRDVFDVIVETARAEDISIRQNLAGSHVNHVDIFNQ
ncbi:MAG: amidohydrolase, partial [Cyclobacteriaceae bacterium]